MTTYFKLPAANGRGLKLQRYDNEIFVDNEAIVPERGLHYMKNFPYQQGDIFICASLKNGNHWMGNMVWKLKSLTDFKINVIELEEKEGYAVQESPRIIQSHMRPCRLPEDHVNNNGKIILLIRNPKDACVSFYYHMKNSEALKNGQTFDEFFESYFAGETTYPIIDYFKEWEDFINDKKEISPVNIEVFYYEDCKMNPMKTLKRLNTFLGFDRDDAYLEKVLEQTRFDSMKAHDNGNKKGIHYLCRDAEGQSIIYRKGEVGDWKNHLTVVQSERVDAVIKEKLTKNIIKIRY